MYKKIIIITLIVLTFPYLLYSQSPSSYELTEPFPIGGYKTLQDSIIYPPILYKADIESAFNAVLTMDTSGIVKQISFLPLFKESLTRIDSSVIQMVVKRRLLSTKWFPARVDGHVVECQIELPFIFILTHSREQLYYALKKQVSYYKFESEPIVIIHSKGYIH